MSQRLKEYESLFHIAIAGSGSFEEKAAAIVQEIAQTWQCDWVTLRLPSADGQTLRLVASAGSSAESVPTIIVASEEQTLLFNALRERRIIVSNDYVTEPNAAPYLLALGMRSLAIFPINVGERTLGLVNIVSRDRNWFSSEHIEVLTSIMDRLGELLEKTESQEHQKERRWQTLFNNSDDAIYLYSVNDDGRPLSFLEVNDAACERLGYSREEFLSMSPVGIVPAGARNETARKIQSVLAGLRLTFEVVHLSKDGRRIPAEV